MESKFTSQDRQIEAQFSQSLAAIEKLADLINNKAISFENRLVFLHALLKAKEIRNSTHDDVHRIIDEVGA